MESILNFGAKMGYFSDWFKVQNCFLVYSYSLTTFIFFVPFNSGFITSIQVLRAVMASRLDRLTESDYKAMFGPNSSVEADFSQLIRSARARRVNYQQ